MSHLRSSLFIAIVSLLLLSGYGVDLFGDCCAHGEQMQAEQVKVKVTQNKQAPGNDDSCQCICHQIMTLLISEPARATASLLRQADVAALPDELPPDAVPLGIDYPPQLA